MDFYIGVMSGTSMDGVDAVLVRFEGKNVIQAGSRSLSFPGDLKTDLEQVVESGSVSLPKLGELDHRLGLCYAECVNSLIGKAGVKRSDVRAIGCHGQTVFHSPGSMYPFTMQIGDGNLIAARTGISTVADFRRMDMAFGGGGAPLAPAFHQYFLNDEKESRGILNLGGIANITMLAQNERDVVGFDTGPASCLMDTWIRTCQGKSFDEDGEWARSGRIIDELLYSMLEENYFQLPAPKSTGRELFNLNWLEEHLKLLPEYDASDVQATLLELTALSVARSVRKHTPARDAVYACGGGACNKYLLERLAFHLPRVKIGVTDELGVPVQCVEAVAFAWLAMRRVNGFPGNLPSVTGASEKVLLGTVYESGS